MKIIRSLDVDAGAYDVNQELSNTYTFYSRLGEVVTNNEHTPERELDSKIRWSYDPDDLTKPPSLLVELAAANFVADSTLDSGVAFLNASWSGVGGDFDLPAVAGYNSSKRLLDSVTGGEHFADIPSSVALEAGAKYTFSIFTDAASLNNVRLCAYTSNSEGSAVIDYAYADFDITDAELLSNASNCTAKITKLRGYITSSTSSSPLRRIEITMRSSAAIVAGRSFLRVQFLDFAKNLVFAGGSNYISLLGAQIENSDFATTYIPTLTGSVARAATQIGLFGTGQCGFASNGRTSYFAVDPYESYSINELICAVDPLDTRESVVKIYKSLENANLGNYPATSPTKWQEVGVDNSWKVLDNSVTSQTQDPSEVCMVFVCKSRVDSLGIFNITGAKVRVQQYIGGELTYDKIVTLTSSSGITSWYDYFYEPIDRTNRLVFTDLPSSANCIVSISVIGSGVGAVAIGQQLDIGGVQYGAKVSIADYSLKSKDEFGNVIITERSYADTADITMMVDGRKVDQIKRTLASFRARPAVYIGDPTGDYESLNLYGFYKDFSETIAYPTQSICTLSIEGLI
jgi:hypothetical protein